MTTCNDCGKAYHSTDSCTFSYVRVDGTVHKRVGGYRKGEKFKQEVAPPPSNERCFDCGVLTDKIHHVGCTAELCPQCGEALATCSCDGGETLRDPHSV